MAQVPAFLFANGLSMALSPNFGLRTITKRFIDGLSGVDKAFLDAISKSRGGLSFDDFEENFALVEFAYDGLKRYRGFMNSKVGKQFLKTFNLKDPKLATHEKIIDRLYRGYISQILDIIHGNVHQDSIRAKLQPFVDFFVSKLKSAGHGFVFTLNYDLLVETILLEYLGTEHFTDFCHPSGKLSGTTIDKFDFNPRRTEEWFTEATKGIQLHHLHGSLSLFYDTDRDRVTKLRSGDIEIEEIYQTIHDQALPLIPAIITGGGKSKKITQYPFDYYYRSMKDVCDFGDATQLFIVGYSFRDDHINDLIQRWTGSVQDYKKGLLITDFKPDLDRQKEFRTFVRSQIRKRPQIPDSCFEFGGANEIHDTAGTKSKHQK